MGCWKSHPKSPRWREPPMWWRVAVNAYQAENQAAADQNRADLHEGEDSEGEYMDVEAYQPAQPQQPLGSDSEDSSQNPPLNPRPTRASLWIVNRTPSGR